MGYTIIPDGDKIEQEGWPLFGKNKFPNYEIFWQKFVVPKTNRPLDIHPKDETTDEECEIMSIHWQIFNNFNFIYKKLRDGFDEDAFDHSYIKLSNTCDLTEELIFKLLLYYGKIDSSMVEVKPKKDIIKITNKFVFTEITRRGSYSIPVSNRISIIKKAITKELSAKVEDYGAQSGRIRLYRNTIAHSWQSFHINGMVPNPDYVKNYQTWVKVTRIIKSNDTARKIRMIANHYIKKEDLITRETEELVHLLNQIWTELIKFIPDPLQGNSGGFVYKIHNLGQSGMVDCVTPSGIGSVQLSGTYSPPPSGCTELDLLDYYKRKGK